MKNTKTAKNLRALCESAIMIALARILAFIEFDIWGSGGSIDFAMVPLVVLAWRRGAVWGVPAGLAFGFLKCITGGGIGYGLPSILLDYVLAYGVVGVAGFFRNEKWGLVVGSFLRFILHFISGVTIWKIAVGETKEIFGITFDSSTAVIYSLVYNSSYMLCNIILCLIAVIMLSEPLKRLPK